MGSHHKWLYSVCGKGEEENAEHGMVAWQAITVPEWQEMQSSCGFPLCVNWSSDGPASSVGNNIEKILIEIV